MKLENSRSIVARRGELLAELFLQELSPKFITRPTTSDVGYDLLAGFSNRKSGINTVAVEVKSTELPPGARFAIPRPVYDRLAHSNVPVLLLVVDVKQNQLYYAWLRAKNSAGTHHSISVPIVAINETTKRELKRELAILENGVVTAV